MEHPYRERMLAEQRERDAVLLVESEGQGRCCELGDHFLGHE